MRFRKLRIAWSVACSILCLLVIVFWVRSYQWFDEFAFLDSRRLISIQSTWEGSLSLGWSEADPQLAREYYSRFFNTRARETLWTGLPSLEGQSKAFKFESYFASSQWYVATPCWFLVITLGTLGALPWIKWRFSVRTLLIATTLVAVVAALMAWVTG